MLAELFVPNNLHDVDKQHRLQRPSAPNLCYYAISVVFSVCGINAPVALKFYMTDVLINILFPFDFQRYINAAFF